MRILLVGGSKSGKSSYAQTHCTKYFTNSKKFYIATMEPFDSEDMIRIENHVKDREGMGFTTLEEGRDFSALLPVIEGQTVLFDSITAYLTNVLFGKFPLPKGEDVIEYCSKEILKLSSTAGDFVCVCDGIWQDGITYPRETEDFSRYLAGICSKLSSEFDVVCEMVAGMKNFLKGNIPC